MTRICDTTIIGAGPYGLSIAAHLRGHGLNFRIIGSPMRSWFDNMPKGMLLKSGGFASRLYAPGGIFSLADYCAEQQIPYEHVDFPIPLETFCAYGMAFQQRFVPDLLDDKLVSLESCAQGFEVHLERGGSFKTARVVLAVGLDYFRYVPQPLQHLPPELCSHSAEHHDLERFRGQDVVVVGGGSSATDLAVLLQESGANVRLVARKPLLEFGGRWACPSRTLWRRIRQGPVTGIGPGWKSLAFSQAPTLYRLLPDAVRIRTATQFLGPSGGWFMKERVARVQAVLGHSLESAEADQEKVRLQLAGPGGAKRALSADHVIAATGYKPDVQRLGFLGRELLGGLQLIGTAPRLSPNFESSVPGLYFVGPVAATSFGPLMRFAVGADFTSRRITKHLARAHRQVQIPLPQEHGSVTEPG
jgi:thioredoxin reductase